MSSMELDEILVSIDEEDLTLGVVRGRDGVMRLSNITKGGGGIVLQNYRACRRSLPQDRTLLGGMLPPSAVGAEVVDDRGRRIPAVSANGAWVAVLPQPVDRYSNPVCYRDVLGTLVAPPLPESWVRSPVRDALETCPACGEVAWEEVQPMDESRGVRLTAGGETVPTPIVVCHSCGHEESMGLGSSIVRGSGRSTAMVQPKVGADEERLYRRRALLAEIHFHVYAADGWPVALANSGRSAECVNSLTVAHFDTADPSRAVMEIETDVDPQQTSSEYALARRALERALYADMMPPRVDRSHAGRMVARRTVDRERRKLAAKATPAERLVQFDGDLETFTFLESGARWVAVHRQHGATITVTAIAVDATTLNLKPIEDLEIMLLTDLSL